MNEGTTVLITGATGFIGGRLVEMLAGRVRVRALVSAYTRTSRIARYPVEMVRGDIRDEAAVAQAARGVDVIFHCAYGSRGTPEEKRAITVGGTKNVIAAARASGARLVHLSTQMVYGTPEKGVITEELPRQEGGGTYAESKVEAEKLVEAAAAAGLPATILQPTAVYGPWAPVWTMGVLARMREGKVPLVNGGEGACNAVYIDDVIQAMLLAARREEALGERFLVSAREPVSWRDFYGSYEEMLGFPATVPVRVEEAVEPQRRGRRWALPQLLELAREEPSVRSRLGDTFEGQLARRLAGPLFRRRSTPSRTPELDKLRRLRAKPELPVYRLSPTEASFYASTARAEIGKAQRLLGYEPGYDLRAGMEITGEWARWARLVPAKAEEQQAQQKRKGVEAQ